MNDYSELKRLAEAALSDNGDYVAMNDYGMAMPPAVVLGLISELEILKYDCKVANSCVNAEKKESKRIIDENESLKKDAARYRTIKKDAISDGSLIERLDCNVRPSEWDSYIDSVSVK